MCLGGSSGLGEENMGGGGIGPISVTPIGGSGRSVRFIAATLASSDVAFDAADAECAAEGPEDGIDRESPDPTVTVVPPPAVLVVVLEETIVTDIVGKTAVRPANLDMIDGEPAESTKRWSELDNRTRTNCCVDGGVQSSRKMLTLCFTIPGSVKCGIVVGERRGGCGGRR